ncbi:exoribonuclease II [Candidatus Erwinia haradaeae]|uniref:Exoribonuclease 2 n=1 Tax=Candidatus Erwinia haradaeae TaxID=1922217 RepID=A0A451DNC2_9GAMM|nr:exoribonuclease II [Candidatus Erwinia haradaeae]VFP88269.1 Exoribonuclease 2 [Candidatus Erwinia haradaeae]
MLQNNPLLVQLKKTLQSKIRYVEGVVKSTEKDFGFLEINQQKSYFIPPLFMTKVMNGDRIIASIKHEKDRLVAYPEKLIQPFLKRFVGRIEKKNNRLFIMPERPLLKQSIQCKPNMHCMRYPLQEGDWTIAEMLHHPLTGGENFFAEIIELITNEKNDLAPWWITLARYNLERKSPNIDSKTEMLDESLDRKDLTQMPFITIDSAGTEDIDDALYIEDIGNGNLKLIVAIADPTAYISSGSPIDTIAAKRLFTNYLPGLNIAMLPRYLSHDVCSLLPNKRRPVLACQVIISPNGTPDRDIQFFAAWITSKDQLIYNNVSDWLEDPQKSNWKPKDAIISRQVNLLNKLRLSRNQWRQEHALLFKDRPDFRFLLSKKGEVLDIIAEHRRVANRIVEESMILVNICAANLLSDHFGFGIYNVHRGFDPIHREQAATMLVNHGINVNPIEMATLEGFRMLRRQLDAQPNHFLSTRIQRFQLLSEIKTTPGPHFGLGLEMYATWTSPIRKYGDMLNHRLIKAIIKGENGVRPSNSLTRKMSERRRQNRMAERDISDLLYSRFLQKSIDSAKKFSAEVIDISKGGMRVRLQDNGATAFIPAYLIEEEHNDLVFSHVHGHIKNNNIILYRITDIIEIVIIAVRIKTRNIIARLAKNY